MKRLSKWGIGMGALTMTAILSAGAGCSDGNGNTGGSAGSAGSGNTGGDGGMGGHGGNGGSPGTGGSGGQGPCNPASHPFALNSTTNDIPPCGSYYTPLNNGTSTVTVFTQQQDPFTVHNTSNAPVQLEAISIVEATGVVDEEFKLQDSNLKDLDFMGATVPAGGKFDFYLRFFPVASGDRSAKVTLTYDGGKTYDFTISGKGTPGADFNSDPKMTQTWLFGSSNTTTDEQAGGMVADAEGNMYFTGNEEESSDNLLVGRLNADGTLGWAKRINGQYNIKAVDSGQNSETGGTAGSVALGADGKLYVVAAASWTSSNNSFYALVSKIEPATGAVIWSKVWSSVPTISVASQSSIVYAIDASAPDRVFLTGATQGEAEIMAVALSATDGSVLFQKRIDIVAGSNDRGYAVKYAGGGNLYIGGQTAGNAGALIKITGADGTNPQIGWTKRIALGTGGNVNAIDADASGNVFVGLDVRGLSSTLGIGSFDSAGATRWIKEYSGNPGDKNNVHVVKLIGNTLYAGGRTSPPNFDGQLGDGALVRMDPMTGAEIDSGFYFSGKGPDELCEHRVKGIAVAGNTLLVALQAYTSTMNGERYWGYWYKGLSNVQDFASPPAVTDVTGTMTTVAMGVSQATSAVLPQLAWEDVPASIVLQNAEAKTGGTPPDADVMLIRMPAP